MKKIYEPLTDTIKRYLFEFKKSTTETCVSDEAPEKLNEKILKLMNDRGMIAPCLSSSLVNIFKPKNKSQFRLLKDLNWIRRNNILTNRKIPGNLYRNMLTFRDGNKSFKLDRDLPESMTIYDFNVSHSNPRDQNLIMSLEKTKVLMLTRKDEKVTENNLL